MRLAPSLLAVGLSLATCAAHAAPVSGPVALRPLTSSTVHPDVLQSANALVVLALKDKRVVVVDAAPGLQAVGGTLIRVGRKAVVQLELLDAGGATLWSGRLTAANPEDLEPVITRLVTGLVAGDKVSENQDIYSVTANEEAPLAQAQANSWFDVGLGGMVYIDDAPAFMPGLSLSWLYDARTFMVDIGLGFWGLGSDDHGGVTMGVGGLVPLSDSDFAPYVGGGIGFAAVSLGQNPTESSLTGNAAVGALLGRTRSVHLRAELRYAIGAFEQTGGLTNALGFALLAGF